MCIMIAGVLAATLGMPAMCGFIRTDLAIAIAVTGFQAGAACGNDLSHADLAVSIGIHGKETCLRVLGLALAAFRLA